MGISIERVAENVHFGEGPHWDAESQSLYFIDLLEKSVHRYIPSSGKYTYAYVGEMVTFIIPIEGQKNKFAAGTGKHLSAISWDGISKKVTNIEKLAEVDTGPETAKNRINDAKADPRGRIFFGTMGHETEPGICEPNKGSVYSFYQGKLCKLVGGMTVSNGLAWNETLKKFYFVDSAVRKIYQFDYNPDTGEISNQKTVFSLEKHDIPGYPDGQTIDSDGNLWIALFAGSAVIKIDPRKPETLLQTVEMPAYQVTSVAFGGKNLDELYVTTARFIVGDKILSEADGHGYVYRVTGLGVKGLPATNGKL